MKRFMERVEIKESGCWEWVAGKSGGGYGAFYDRESKKQVPAHRWLYERTFGSISDGMDLDHVCHNNDQSCSGGANCRHRSCVNPDHLEPVTRKVNLLRSTLTLTSQKAAKTHCVHGHEYTPENTKLAKNGTRHCRECNNKIQRGMKRKRDRNEYMREYYKRRRAAAQA
jgi:hypothetical protein